MLRAVLNGELHLRYQPLVSLDHFGLVGFEALLRWQHPEYGLLLPGDFLAAAEAQSLTAPIGRWVIRNACRHAAAWSAPAAASARSLVVSVNVSSRHLEGGNLARTVAQALEVSGLEPHLLALEISPRALRSDRRALGEHLHALRALGIGLSFDAVRGETAPCRELSQLGFSGVKLDGARVAGCASSRRDTALLAAEVRAAHTHGLRVTAVGVERSEHVAALRSLGCDVAQGFYFARPQTQEVVDALVHHPFRWRDGTPHHDVA
jgi:EAL domain-containing protein (putative c-di-GMP-specific phosphodiesterase class I)